MTEKEYVDLYRSYIENWTKINFWDFPQEEVYESSSIGDTFDIDPLFVRPNLRNGEWDESKDGLGITEGPIDVEKKDGEFIIVDGHHRFFESLIKNKESIAIRIVEPSFTTR